ncbi:hypothetical protein SLEP1_g15038 [Rubroshorea leprosula]|uniref:Uncharacterized protein n=1 Tax=Rubroshorea leprosula TaxID=152421 RepID=A0AAV5IS55_9ROSI|nr:hypothetical protein SLEP1_g15038 [Rubroshorea leprosula]
MLRCRRAAVHCHCSHLTHWRDGNLFGDPNHVEPALNSRIWLLLLTAQAKKDKICCQKKE